jgi:hypothetical protein
MLGLRRTILASGVAAIGVAAVLTGCGGSSRGMLGASTAMQSSPPASTCRLSARQRRAVAAAERDIRRLRQLEAPLTTFSEKGSPALQEQTNKVLMDILRVRLPINTQARLLRLAKGAVGLCGLCFGAFEAEEPTVESHFGYGECAGR